MIRNWLTIIALLLAALCGPLTTPVGAQTPINSYPAVYLVSEAYGINDTGQVVGSTGHAALWQNGSVKDLGGLLNETGALRVGSTTPGRWSAFQT